MRLLGIDYGARRIGLAISDPSGVLARPLRAIRRDEGPLLEQVLRAIEAMLAEEDGLGTVVIGMPRRLDGSRHDLADRVQALADALRARVRVPIVFQDERLTSHEAEARLTERHRDWRDRKARLDAAAAAIILQDYIDEHR